MNDQPEPQHPTPPPAPNPAADATTVQPPAFGTPPTPQPGMPYGAPPASPYSPPNAPYGAQDGTPPYGAQPGPAYGAPQPGAYPGYPASGAPGYPPPGSGGTSGFAIASLIFGILGGILFSVIFGIVALFQIRKRGQTGRGLAITGLVLSGCWVLLIAGGITVAIISDAGNSSASSSSGSTADTDTDSGTVSVTKLKPGNCINGLNGIGSIEDLPVVSCALPHEGEVYAVFELPAGPWPGDTAVQEQSETRCKAELETYAPKAADTVEVLYLHPLQLSWSRDRGVTCVATDERGTSLGSVRD
ncbi:DUF4190 domain-containing protein [Actinoplanes sp. ATCC 53533]|uniref:DUF4190 domain-containing protein n=1 Tax=Actinoplanes sp. ATCC 53533 TaxID=1288362 RepID=UPI00131599DD|nr:DUF4190 domain-containing protein [Actinoplanes sp. ATCC 53533]